MGLITHILNNATSGEEHHEYHHGEHAIHNLTDTSTYPVDLFETTTPHKIMEWLGAHEVISLVFVGLFVVLTLSIAAIYYTYKRSPCCKPCRKEKLAKEPSKLTPNLSQVFVKPRDADRFKIERLDSDDSIRKL